jgi:hypothetical protein
MTITISPILFPIILSFIFFVFAVLFYIESGKRTYEDFLNFFLSVVFFSMGILSWTVYYTVLYFLK